MPHLVGTNTSTEAGDTVQQADLATDYLVIIAKQLITSTFGYTPDLVDKHIDRKDMIQKPCLPTE